ncbi:MAG: HAD family phosphatase [Bacteroidaceae bacterium]|nr:HAD family phosphatase [Bacteroidaceae bacterium]
MIKTIIFDFGGVIVDVSKQGAIDNFTTIGLPNAATCFDEFKQTGIFNEVEEGSIDATEFCKKLGVMCQKEISFEQARYGWMGFVGGLQVEKLDFLLELRKKYKLLLLSNTNPFVMSWARSENLSERRLPLDHYFDKLYMSYDCGYTKPGEAIFQYMVRDANIKVEETLFIDDGAHNIATAKRLGFQTFQPKNATDWREELIALLS